MTLRNHLFSWALALSSIATQAAPTRFGTYLGYLKHDRLNRQQVAKLDFVVSREDAAKITLSAVLTLQFGGFESGEYVAYHYDNVEFNLLTGQLVFDQSDQSAFLTTTQFANGVLKANFSSIFSGPVGELTLKQGPLAAPTLPLIGSVSGEYRGTCPGERPLVMQLNAVRSTEDTFQIGNPFGPYRIVGTVAQVDPTLCATFENPAPGQACVITDVGASSYNFFSGVLSLIGRRRNFQCRVQPNNELDCGGCRFNKTLTTDGALSLTPTQAAPYFRANESAPPSATPIAGEYFGYVHHERLNRFQPAKLTLSTFQSLNENGGQELKLAAAANLYFGDFESPHFTSYRFETIPLPNPLLSRHFALSRHEADVDAILEITELGNGIVRGVWQSKMFGRVGTFEMRQAGAPLLPASAQRMHDFTGFYTAPEWELNLSISLGRTPINSNNPFDPLKVAGYLRAPMFTGKLPITASSYDFFTNRMSLTYENEGQLIVRPGGNGTMLVRRISNIYGSPLQSYAFEAYHLQPTGGSR